MKRPLPGTIVALGFTSLFTDIGTEMIFPLLPAFLATLGAGPAFLGILEGAADATASLLKLYSGARADRRPRKKPFVVFGYALASLVRPLAGLATLPWHIFLIRISDRIGKGLRSSPRDLMLAAAAPPGEAGRAFGFHNAMDHAGALLGPLLATALVAAGLELRAIFFLAFIPGALAVIAVLLAKEPPAAAPAVEVAVTPAAAPKLPRPLQRYLVVVALFSLGNSSDAFLLIRAQDLGVSISNLPLLWAALSAVKMVSASLGGSLSDRVPRARLIGLGWGVYALSYVLLAQATQAWHVWALFALYGTYYGLSEPVEKALVKDLAPEAVRGRAYGMYNFLAGIMALAAGLLTGGIWQKLGAEAALNTGAAIALLAGLLLMIWVRPTASTAATAQ